MAAAGEHVTSKIGKTPGGQDAGGASPAMTQLAFCNSRSGTLAWCRTWLNDLSNVNRLRPPRPPLTFFLTVILGLAELVSLNWSRHRHLSRRAAGTESVRRTAPPSRE